MDKLITTKMNLKDAFPNLAGEYEDDAVFIRKGLVPSDLKVEEGERAIVSYITTAAKDRDGEIVLPSGADLKHYRKNPVVLFGHDYKSLPIGKNLWIKSDEKGLIAKTQYAKHDQAEKVYQYRKDGFPLAESIGFVPLKFYYKKWRDGGYKWDEGDLRILEQDHGLTEKDLKDVWTVYTKWSLLEYSDVAVPANQEAIELAKSKGLFGQTDKTTVTEWEENGTVTQVETSDQLEPNESTENDLGNKGQNPAQTLETLAESMKALTDTVLSMKDAMEGILPTNTEQADDQIEDEPSEDIITLDFLGEEKESDLEFTMEDVQAVVADIMSNKSLEITAQSTNIKGIVDEALMKMLGKVVVE